MSIYSVKQQAEIFYYLQYILFFSIKLQVLPQIRKKNLQGLGPLDGHIKILNLAEVIAKFMMTEDGVEEGSAS